MDTWNLITPLAYGTLITVFVSTTAIMFGLLLGLGLAILRDSKNVVVVGMVATYVSAIRGTPGVLLILLIYFALPVVGLSLSPITAGIVGLAINSSAFQAEIWRAQLDSFPRGQQEAAYAAGMTRLVAFRRIVFPQAWISALPALVSEMSLIVKASPAIGVIGVVDLTRVAVRTSAATFEPVAPFLIATAIYVVIVSALLATQRLIEMSFRRKYGMPA